MSENLGSDTSRLAAAEFLEAVNEYCTIIAEYFPPEHTDSEKPIILGDIKLDAVFEDFKNCETKIKEKREKWQEILGVYYDNL